ncbi:hypothetical protein JCM15765_10940 [Paradesulfitobacterium aromaticivorans]
MKLYSPQRFKEKFIKALARGKRLLGDIPLSDKEYQALLPIASNKIKVMRYSGLSLQADLVLAVALVRIGMHAYRDGNFWGMLEETLGLKISTSQSQHLGQVFLNTLRTHNLFVWEGSKANKSRYVTNIMIHGIVPDDYLEDFFDFVFAFFDLNLKRDASGKFGTDLAYMMSFIADSLNNNTLSEQVSFTDGKTVSVYRLRKATKIAFTQFERRTKAILRTTLGACCASRCSDH